ncbi:MAG: hypothetical protein CM15mP101_05890 [Flavobacteriaceae bacterium]|nr:MAG: hypothetical protein CM15mP101_05890 [Flavobacteriaceae bacterium]|tara:strand:- start:448 stop:975 length:528 start_codon:yes stop_codon:yes gene_type:complete
MKKYFQFSGTINGTTYLLRLLFTMLMSIPLLVISMMGLGTAVFGYLGYDLEEAATFGPQEQQEMGEKLGMAMVENPSEVMSGLISNISAGIIIAFIVFLIPVIWFYWATCYKRISALFPSTAFKVFIGFIVIEAILDILPIAVGGSTITAFSAIVGLGIFIFLLSKNSTIGEHDG